MSILNSVEFSKVVRDFIFLQSKLRNEFLDQNKKSTDWKYLTDLRRKGIVSISGEEWMYALHGAGVRFESHEGLVVDIHKFILIENVVDAHRICEYIYSIKKNISNEIDVYKFCENSLRNMAFFGEIKKMDVNEEAWTYLIEKNIS
jgi:hypothetical protein